MKLKAWAVIDDKRCYEILLSKKEVESVEKNSAKFIIMRKQGLKIVPCIINI